MLAPEGCSPIRELYGARDTAVRDELAARLVGDLDPEVRALCVTAATIDPEFPLEALLVAAGGRPHWGKWHGLGAGQLADRYPEWHRFLELREELDPRGLFLNEHLRSVLLG